MGVPVGRKGADNAGNYEVAARHADSTDKQSPLATPRVDEQNGRDGGQEFEDTDDSRGQQRSSVGRQIKSVKNEWGIV